MTLKYLGIICLLFSIQTIVSGQVNPKFCGTPSPAKPVYVDVDKVLAEKNRSLVLPEVVEVFVHFTTDNGGFSPIVDIDTFMARFQDMKGYFFPHDICFLFVGSQIIQNSDLDFHKIFGEGMENNEQDEILPFLKPGVLNVFVHHVLIHGGIVGGGNAYAIPNTYLSIDDDALSAECCRGTLAHEVGHCLGLYHTFQWRWGSNGQIREKVARTGSCKNCTTEGDLLCDTPADPHELAIIDSDTTYMLVWDHTTNCVFDTVVLDGCPDQYNPDETNIMSYFADSCHTNFTAGQGLRALDFLNGELADLKAPENLTITINATNSSGEYFHTAKQEVTYAAASLNYTAAAILWSASGNSIKVLPGTTFAPGSGFSLLSAQTVCQ